MEGDGEVHALPVLLRRLASEQGMNVEVETPIRVRRDKFLNKEDEFRRQLCLAAAKSGEDGWVLIVLDADDDCPAHCGQEILRRTQKHIAHRRVSVVLVKREFEAWFIAAARSLHLQNTRGFSLKPDEAIEEAETPRDAKGWMRRHMQSGKYSEILDQPAFTAQIDLQQAFDNSRSFRKLRKEWQIHVLGEA
ncbi:MAG: DUF4276 family protein [Azoarcus sp.]|nr:DUF4276 family protein [Azoarcus sp.]